MEKYESSQKQIRRSAETIYAVLADFNNFTPLVADRVEGWAVEGDECSFTVKGMKMGLRMVEKVPGELIKIEAADSSPVGFTLWVQLKETGRNADGGFIDAPDTRMRLVLHVEMNMMIKMMIGSKLQGGIEQMAEQIAKTFNAI
ncbi:MAG: polyketide cyclase [Alistipes sp.]|nr:polyketide cyclase [Alistipes sp.]